MIAPWPVHGGNACEGTLALVKGLHWQIEPCGVHKQGMHTCVAVPEPRTKHLRTDGALSGGEHTQVVHRGPAIRITRQIWPLITGA